jgi:arabinose-5-phosphate isomerase
MTTNTTINQTTDFRTTALSVIETEAQAIYNLANRIDGQFIAACELLLQCAGRIIVTGIGKSGHIGRKIAATLASTGSPAFFVHPGEACHGDIGMITANDVVLAISNSGTNQEILILLPFFKRFGIPIIALSGRMDSPLAQAATIVLDVSVSEEACPLGLAPTASTTAALVMGDALAMALVHARGFTADDFALSHPGGQLGRRLLLRIEDIMHQDEELPLVHTQETIAECVLQMSRKGFGHSIIIDDQRRLQGIYSDGDLRRTIEHKHDLNTTPIGDVMTTGGKTIGPKVLAIEGLNIMQAHKITGLVVVNEQHQVLGLVHMHDLLRHGIA